MTLRPAALVVACLLAVGLAGCIGTPAPTTSTSAPAFASDAEAYKAAEKVYRAYVDALNQVDLADPKTFEPVFALSTGDANAADRKGLSRYHADQVSISGESRITVLEAKTVDGGRTKVALAACVDVSQVHLTNPDGSSAVAPDRVSVQTLTVSLVAKPGSPRSYLVERVGGREGAPSCG